MKKLALVLAVVGFAAVSCKKEVACECTVTFLGTSTTATSDYVAMNKKDRDAHKTSCEAGSTAGISTCKQLTK